MRSKSLTKDSKFILLRDTDSTLLAPEIEERSKQVTHDQTRYNSLPYATLSNSNLTPIDFVIQKLELY